MMMMMMHHFRKLIIGSSSASALKLEREQNYLKHGAGVLEALLALCNGNCRIPLRYFTATEIERATQHSEQKNTIEIGQRYKLVGCSLDQRLVLVRGSDIGNVYRDIAITCQMSHLKNVLRLTGCCLEFEEPYFVHEYVEAITLADLLFNKDNRDPARKSLLSWGSRLQIANEVASVVVFLHTEFATPIIHRDLKPSKVIIDQNSGVAKLYDFSLSVLLPPGKLQIEEEVGGTLGYIDPEYCRSGIITQKSDVYSFGVLLLELLTGKKLIEKYYATDIDFEDLPPFNIEMPNIIDIVDPAVLEEYGIGIQEQLEDYIDLVKKCGASNREDRPYMIDVARELRRIQKCFRAFALDQN